jgi:hypothetical protein
VTVYGFGKYQTQRRATERTYAPHEEADLRAEDLPGLVVDDLTGPVGDLEWEKASANHEHAPLSWHLVDLAVNASKNGGRWDVLRDRFALQSELNGGAA